MTARPPLLRVWLLLALGGAGCTLLADFQDKALGSSTGDGGDPEASGPDDRDGAVAVPDAAPPAEASADRDGPGPSLDATVEPFTCANQADGTQVPDTTQRCCGHVATALNTPTNCGACGITCDTAHGHSCQVRGGRAMCVGCKNDAGGTCWTGCCQAPISSPDGVCAPNGPPVLCLACDDGVCNEIAPGSSCKSDFFYGNTCAY
jgi:hypothetical protein